MNKAINISPRIRGRVHGRIGPLHQVNLAGNTMTEVVDSTKRVTDVMGEIIDASDEQASGVAQVGAAVSQMDQATQQNAALVE